MNYIGFVISFGISIAASLLFPFPISLITIIGVFILLNFCMRKRMMGRIGIGMGGGAGAGGRIPGSSSSSMFEDTCLKSYYMSCGMQHMAVCPKCSSKMKKVGFR